MEARKQKKGNDIEIEYRKKQKQMMKINEVLARTSVASSIESNLICYLSSTNYDKVTEQSVIIIISFRSCRFRNPGAKNFVSSLS